MRAGPKGTVKADPLDFSRWTRGRGGEAAGAVSEADGASRRRRNRVHGPDPARLVGHRCPVVDADHQVAVGRGAWPVGEVALAGDAGNRRNAGVELDDEVFGAQLAPESA